jgi:hypothetical protein
MSSQTIEQKLEEFIFVVNFSHEKRKAFGGKVSNILFASFT